ncbi:MAG TPA: twin-arginine translocase TatA/TatE family subunit [Protaetiibacter sp.]|jgi:sec-independent protein translocase protein TatA|nr:twin-arginine translocase TatA/TatE family subunit [Protaetiibacter sp.]
MFIHTLFVNQWQTWLIILLVVLVLFGATRLPALSKSLGQSVKIFRKEMTDDEKKTAAESGTTTSEAADTAKPVDSSAPTDKS